MNTFLPLMCFVSMGFAALLPGYNYQQQNLRPFSYANNNGIYSNQQAPPLSNPIANPTSQYPQKQINTPAQYYGQPAAASSSNVVATPALQFNYQNQGQQQVNVASSHSYQSQPQQQTIISKEIYIHSAPEETEEISSLQGGGGESGPIRKNYRIVFIKAPSPNIKFNTQLIKQTQALNEEKTIIYVLTKKPDIATIQTDFVTAQAEQKTNRPEVYFIKYKTPEEASRAQQEIQAQYDALGGSTRISDEGIAPVTSVISGGTVNVGSIGSVNNPSVSSGTNFIQSASDNQPQIAQFARHSQQQIVQSASSNQPQTEQFSNSNQQLVQSASSNQQQFVKAASNNQQQFIQSSIKSFQGGQSNAVGVEVPSRKYLPPKRI